MTTASVTFTTQMVVCVQVGIVGEERSFPHLPEADNFVAQFMRFLSEQDILPAVRRMAGSSTELYRGLFTAEDAAKIEAWLLEQGSQKTS